MPAQSKASTVNQDRLTSLLLSSVREGCLLINPRGLCEGVYTAACEKIFGVKPGGRHIFDLLKIPPAERDSVSEWLSLAFADRLSEQDINELGPSAFAAGQGISYRLRFEALKEDGQVCWLAMTASDQTRALEAEQALSRDSEEDKLAAALAEDKESFQSFVRTAVEIFNNLKDKKALSPEEFAQFRMDLHTLKGGASTFHMRELEQALHSAEMKMHGGLVPQAADLKQMVAYLETVLAENLGRYQSVIGIGEDWLDHVVISRRRITDLVAHGLQEGVADTFLEGVLRETLWSDVRSLFEAFSSTVQVTARKLGKSVYPLAIVSSEELRVPLDPYRKLINSLVHLFRNAVDHGLEGPDERMLVGKSVEGMIKVMYGSVPGKRDWWVEIEDDGRGVDVGALRRRLQTQGRPAQQMSEAEVLCSLFEQPLSTRQEVTDISGMGVGLPAVGAALREIGGTYSVTSMPGMGTRFRLEIPWIDQLSRFRKNVANVPGAKPSGEEDLNFRYNMMISDMAVLVRESLHRQQLENEIGMARAVQKALMPPAKADYGPISVSGRCYAAESCGGDWWFHSQRDGKLTVWIGDVLGHDIAAALVASACRATIAAMQIENLAASVPHQMGIMNEVIHSMTGGDVYLTAICLTVNLRTGEMEIGCASHPPSILVQPPGHAPTQLEIPSDPPLGLSTGVQFHSVKSVLKPGEILFLMTDGLLDLPTSPKVHWRERRLIQLLKNSILSHENADGIICDLEKFIADNGSGKLADDMTYVAVSRKRTA